MLPFIGSVTGLTVAAFGCWIWPRRHRAVWLLLGYAVTLGTLCAGYTIATGNSP
ncbi:hypothetical protein [Micromonospora sp. NPDC005087]|uniref:hypothetical protein n=1 Tax=Micromonospora sp. NPDC005087 TaxID=3364225 RepID=UPI00369720D5